MSYTEYSAQKNVRSVRVMLKSRLHRYGAQDNELLELCVGFWGGILSVARCYATAFNLLRFNKEIYF